jgi:hypothetical protein
MTLKDLLGQVVGNLEQQQQELNSVDPAHPTHGTDLLNKFQAAYQAAPSDPNADLGQAFQQVSGAIGSQGTGFTARSYGDAFSQGAQAFQGRPNQLSANDLGPIIGMLTQGFANHDTRGVNAAGALGALGPLLGMLTGNRGGGMGDLAGMLGGLMGGNANNNAGGGLGGLLGGLMNGTQPQQQNNPLGNVLGGLLGGGQAQMQPQQSGIGGMGDILGQLMGAVQQGSQMTNANGQRDAGAVSTGSVVSSVLGALLGGR